MIPTNREIAIAEYPENDRNEWLVKSRGRIRVLWLLVAGLIVLYPFYAYLVSFPTTISRLLIFAIPAGLLVPLLRMAYKQIGTLVQKVEKESLVKRIAKRKIDYLDDIIQNSYDILITVDSDLRILKFNRGAEFHSGFNLDEIIGKPLDLLLTEKEKLTSVMGKAGSIGNCLNEELCMVTKDGSARNLIVSVSQLRYDNIAINGFVVLAKDITHLKSLEKELLEKNQQLSVLAITDSLTNLYNVRFFYEQIKKELKRIERNPAHKFSLVLLDIDCFKELNDSEGHQMGDHVLSSLAEIIRVCIRRELDLAFRYGGDEFVIVLPDTEKEKAHRVAERILRQFEALKFGKTSLSIGITEATSEDNDETIVKRADDAMYSAKRNGKGCIALV